MRGSTERPACRAAVVQALRYHFGLRTTVIARLMKLPPQTISSLTVCDSLNVLQWHVRRFKSEAIQVATKLVEEQR